MHVSRLRPFSHDGIWRRLLPFAGSAVLGIVVLLQGAPMGSRATDAALISVAGTVAIVLLAVFFPWDRFPESLQAIPPVGYIVIVLGYMLGTGNELIRSEPLLLLPIFWMALYHPRSHLLAGLAAIWLVLPIMLLREANWAQTLFWPVASTVISVAIERSAAKARELDRALVELARKDALTGLANRRAWDEECLLALARARREGYPLSLAILDLDHFKAFNDQQGHQSGDQLLQEVGVIWRRALRQTDLMARYGGEEFAVLLPGCRLEHAMPLINRLRVAVPRGQTCSAGVACWDGSETRESLTARADAALFEAKRRGRNQIVAASSAGDAGDPEGPPALVDWAATVLELLDGRARIVPVFQPIVALGDGTVVGYEALARLASAPVNRRVEGLFHTARRMGVGRDLDWLCAEAALANAGFLPPGALLFLNVSLGTLVDPAHDPTPLLFRLQKAERSPHQVVIEFAEQERVMDLDRLRTALAAYRDLGFRIALDDAGEAASTLTGLTGCLPHYIKIGPSLTRTVEEHGSRAAILALVAFAEATGATLIAEAVETEAIARQMAGLGVQLGQGDWLGEPVRQPLAGPRALPGASAA